MYKRQGAYIALSRRSRASSTPRLDAASISTTSRAVCPPQIRVQDSHSPQGSPSSVRSGQLRAIANTRASVVFPTPRGPQKRYACPTRLFATARRNVSETCSCVATSEKARGLCLRAKALWLNALCHPCNVNCYSEVPQATRSDNHRTYRCYLRGPGGVRGLSPCGPGALGEATGAP